MSDSIDLTIIMPCKNEEAHISSTLNTVAAAMKEVACSLEILVMDDGSTDRTSELVKQYQREHPELPLRLHRNPQNIGLSNTYVDGAFLARGKYCKMMSGDNAEPAEALVAIFKRIGEADMIIPYHEKLRGKSATRVGVSKLYTFLVNLFSGNSIRYYNGGAIHLRYNILRWHSYAYGFGFQADFITRLIQQGATYVEIPVRVTHTNKGRGASPLNSRNFVSTAHTLMEIFRRRVNRWIFKA
jgi:glycosyltransferase involved in cell wall biosynthesis